VTSDKQKKSSDEWHVMSDKQKSPNFGVRSPMSQVGFAHRSSLVTRHYSCHFARQSSLTTRHCFFWFGVLAASLLAASVARGDGPRKPTLEAIGNEVQCTCGCNAPLNQCPHLDCAQKAEMQAFLKKEIAEGKDETAILQDLSLRYGVQVLSTPPAHGFNLAIWILPGVGLLVGLGIVMVIVRRWKRKPAGAPAPTFAANDPKILTAVEEEMKSTGLG
jgi:cytochrome c-type biogenesis protein CcmH/NrfF